MVLITPVQIGIGVMCLCWTVVLCLYSFTSYYYNGWHVTPLAQGCLCAALLFLGAYACAAALLIEPLSFTGVSAVAMGFQMCLFVPAMYMMADTRGVSLTFHEWQSAVQNLNTDILKQKMITAAEKEMKNPLEALFKSMNTRREKDNEQSGNEDRWKDQPISSVLTQHEIVQDTELATKRTNFCMASTLFGVGLLILLGYSLAIFFKAKTYLGFVTIAAVLAYDLTLIVVAGNSAGNSKGVVVVV